MMKKIVKFVLLLCIMTVFASGLCVDASAQGTASQASSIPEQSDKIIEEQEQKSGAAGLSNNVPESAKSSLSSLGINGSDNQSLARFTPANLLKAAISSLKETASAPVKSLCAVLAIIIACALLNTLKSSFADKSLQGVFNIVSSLCIAAIILAPVSQCVSYCAKVITDSSKFMLTFLPVFSTLAVASGHPASAVATQSILLVSSEALSRITATTFVPMVDIYLAFCVVGSVSSEVNINGIASFVKTAVSWALGLCLAIYTGILTVQGVIASASDNLTIKTAKFVANGAVPVIGGAISDAMNTVISCAGLLKTSVGAYAIIVFIFTFLPPVLECLLWILTAELSFAVADILGISNMSGLLKSVSEALKLLIALISASALVMIVSVSVMLLLGMNN
jgi:stage III sporulation protein AE